MSRDGLSCLLCAALLLGSVHGGMAAPPDDRSNRMETLLAVQRALKEGRDHCQRGNYQAAVSVLEGQVARINGDREYLDVLRDAYRSLVRELQRGNRSAELSVY